MLVRRTKQRIKCLETIKETLPSLPPTDIDAAIEADREYLRRVERTGRAEADWMNWQAAPYAHKTLTWSAEPKLNELPVGSQIMLQGKQGDRLATRRPTKAGNLAGKTRWCVFDGRYWYHYTNRDIANAGWSWTIVFTP